ncbi:MAG: hypothetical protein HZA48_01500 [Planctomycetes bacterium]|nr:hypothetical protein [Planctomycetota bacterium]
MIKSFREKARGIRRLANSIAGRFRNGVVKQSLETAFWGVCIGGASLVLVLAAQAAHEKNRELNLHLNELSEESRILAEYNKDLIKEANTIKEDPFYVESILRNDYNMIGAKEAVVEMEVGGRKQE